jgi:trimeric autotransporter adhesin
MNAFRKISPLRTRRPRYADIAATVALLFSMGGTAYAATALAPNTVGTPQLKDHAVTAIKIHPSAVAATSLMDGAVTNSKIGAGAVTNSKLGLNSIVGANVAKDSLSLADLVGADVSGAISFSLGAGSCGTLNMNVSGAQVGQVVLFSFTGNVGVASVTFGGTRVTSAGHISVRACNAAASTVSVSNLGIRIITFG